MRYSEDLPAGRQGSDAGIEEIGHIPQGCDSFVVSRRYGVGAMVFNRCLLAAPARRQAGLALRQNCQQRGLAVF